MTRRGRGASGPRQRKEETWIVPVNHRAIYAFLPTEVPETPMEV
jgi:hypothetical protein